MGAAPFAGTLSRLTSLRSTGRPSAWDRPLGLCRSSPNCATRRSGAVHVQRHTKMQQEKSGAGAGRSPTRRPTHRSLTRAEGRRRSGRTPANLSPATRARCGTSPRAPRRVDAKTRARARPLPVWVQGAQPTASMAWRSGKRRTTAKKTYPNRHRPTMPLFFLQAAVPYPQRQYNPLSAFYFRQFLEKINA